MYISERCGAWQIGDDADRGVVEFRVFFPAGVDPHVTSIRVAGDFQGLLGGQDWDVDGGLPLVPEQRDDPRGTFWSARTAEPLPTGFYEYKYVVGFDGAPRRWVTDPCARYGGLHDRNSGIVVGGSSPADNAVRPLPAGRAPLTDLNLYELMIDDFTAEYRAGRAPLAAVVDRLDDLRAMGINGILFMPWTAWKNRDFDWGYEPFQFLAVEARYANDADQPAEKLSWLKRLVSACHDRGIQVIMDGVFNHVSTDFPYQFLYREPELCPFTAETFVGAFPGLQDLDFAQPATGEFIDDVCRYWADTFGIDGIRFDNTVNYYRSGDPRGLPEILSGIADHVERTGGNNFSLTLEHIDVSAAQVTNLTEATSFWDNSLYALTFDALWRGRIDGRILGALNNRRFLSPGKVPTLYLSNHDHSQVGWQAGARENTGAVGGWWKVQPFLIALFTGTGVPMIPNGQEFAEEHFLPEDDQGLGRRVSGRPLRWKLRTDRIGRTMVALHTRLARMRSAHPALRSAQLYPAAWPDWQNDFDPVGVGVDAGRQLAIYHRWAVTDSGTENIVVALNFSDHDQTVDVPVPLTGRWTDLLAGFDGGDPWSIDVADFRPAIGIGSHWGRVLLRTG
jgi:1,4-alpha-glucan branching enzyme